MTMITPSYLGETIEYSSLHACRSTLEDPTVDDLIRGIIALAESGHHDPVNIGNPNEFTLLELARTVLEVTGSSSEIVYEALPTDDPKQRQPDITLAKKILGWEPTIELREGLERTISESGAEALIGAAP